MKKNQKVIFTFSLLLLLAFLFWPVSFPKNLQLKETLNSSPFSQVVIIFNSGGLGYTPLEKATDFAPIVLEIKNTLQEWGYNSLIVSYQRTENNFWGKIWGIREVLNSFKNQSQELAREIEWLVKNNPQTKIIITGLSNGGAFVEETFKDLSQEAKSSVYVIEAGVPFWQKIDQSSQNILRLNNGGKDSLAKGKIKTLIFSFLKAPFKLLISSLSREKISFSEAMRVPGHEYQWKEVSPEIISFLKVNLSQF